MTDGRSICVAVLAAGQSRRFGEDDKLIQLLDGNPLAMHICDTLLPLEFSHSFVITSAADHPCVPGWRDRGFEIAVNHAARDGLGGSVALAAELAAETQCDALLVCLADMPFVPSEHLERLIETYRCADDAAVIATKNGRVTTPPAIFGSGKFPALASLNGETGARDLLSKAATIPLAPRLLRDIDTIEALAEANRRG